MSQAVVQAFGKDVITPTVKILFLVLAALSHYIGFKPPHPPPSNGEIIYKGQRFENVVQLLALATRVSIPACMISECAVFLSLYYPTAYSPYILSNLCPGSSPSLSALSTINPFFLFGFSIMLASGALRMWCYKTLGSFFIFEVTIQRSHKLITSGPYAYVRHPGYTGGVLLIVSTVATCFSPGSYINECHIMATPMRWWIRFWLTCAMYTTVALWRRGEVEDNVLRKAFGETWEHYSQNVPWRFVPGLF